MVSKFKTPEEINKCFTENFNIKLWICLMNIFLYNESIIEIMTELN